MAKSSGGSSRAGGGLAGRKGSTARTANGLIRDMQGATGSSLRSIRGTLRGLMDKSTPYMRERIRKALVPESTNEDDNF